MRYKNLSETSLLLLALIVISSSLYSFNKVNDTHDTYRCIPCGLDCDKDLYDHPGKCLKCEMKLVESSTIDFGTIHPDTICSYLKAHPQTILLDVRTKEEFEGDDPGLKGLQNAINIPILELETKIENLAEYKNRDIIVYCSHSHRSPQVCYNLTQYGFKKVVNMMGGVSIMKDNSCRKSP